MKRIRLSLFALTGLLFLAACATPPAHRHPPHHEPGHGPAAVGEKPPKPHPAPKPAAVKKPKPKPGHPKPHKKHIPAASDHRLQNEVPLHPI